LAIVKLHTGIPRIGVQNASVGLAVFPVLRAPVVCWEQNCVRKTPAVKRLLPRTFLLVAIKHVVQKGKRVLTVAVPALVLASAVLPPLKFAEQATRSNVALKEWVVYPEVGVPRFAVITCVLPEKHALLFLALTWPMKIHTKICTKPPEDVEK
jgi:hypothetical protein